MPPDTADACSCRRAATSCTSSPGNDRRGWVSDQALDLYLHAGKRRVRTDDATLIAELAAKADVVVAEGATADAINALGLDGWAAPVKVAITPFGRTGPKRNWQASANVLLAMGGYTYIMGDAERAPLTLPGHYPEFQGGAFAYAAANACRLAGERKTVDIGMLEVVMALSQFTTVMWHCLGAIRERHGSDFHYVVPTNLFRCADGWAYVNIVPTFWDAFAAFLSHPEIVLDARFETNESRRAHRHALHAIIAEAMGAADVRGGTPPRGGMPHPDRGGAKPRRRVGRSPACDAGFLADGPGR